MIINEPEVKRVVDDYDFVFISGQMMPVTIDKEAGDTVEIDKDSVVINLTAKKSLTDPNRTLPAEEITIFAKHLISIQHRKREVVELTAEQKVSWMRTLQELNSTIQ